MVDWACNFIGEFLSVNLVKNRLSAPSSPNSPIWIPPDPGIYKTNCDIAIDVAGCLVGFGPVIHDAKGFVMAASS